MISHFLLNLQEIAKSTTNGTDPSCLSFVRSERGQLSSIRFNCIIGNLGESLRDGSPEADDDEAEGMFEDAAMSNILQEDEEAKDESAASLRVENVSGEDL